MSLFDYRGYTPATWILIFCNTTTPRWHDRLFKPGFRHVYAVKFVGDCVVTYNPQLSHTDIDIEVAEPETMAPAGSTVVEVTAWRREGVLRVPFYMGPITCVESCKALLGIRGFWPKTPWQLYKQLARGHHNGIFQVYRGVTIGTRPGL